MMWGVSKKAKAKMGITKFQREQQKLQKRWSLLWVLGGDGRRGLRGALYSVVGVNSLMRTRKEDELDSSWKGTFSYLFPRRAGRGGNLGGEAFRAHLLQEGIRREEKGTAHSHSMDRPPPRLRPQHPAS